MLTKRTRVQVGQRTLERLSETFSSPQHLFGSRSHSTVLLVGSFLLCEPGIFANGCRVSAFGIGRLGVQRSSLFVGIRVLNGGRLFMGSRLSVKSPQMLVGEGASVRFGFASRLTCHICNNCAVSGGQAMVLPAATAPCCINANFSCDLGGGLRLGAKVRCRCGIICGH